MSWIVEWSYPSDNSVNVTSWGSESDALQSAVTDVMHEIRNSWDMSEFNERTEAKEINELVRSGAYQEALARFNGSDRNTNSEYAQYWHVYETKMRSFQRTVLILDDAFFADPDEEIQEEETPVSAPVSVKVAQPVVAVNDHVCVSCGNTACSRTEKACWKCGHRIAA